MYCFPLNCHIAFPPLQEPTSELTPMGDEGSRLGPDDAGQDRFCWTIPHAVWFIYRSKNKGLEFWYIVQVNYATSLCRLDFRRKILGVYPTRRRKKCMNVAVLQHLYADGSFVCFLIWDIFHSTNPRVHCRLPMRCQNPCHLRGRPRTHMRCMSIDRGGANLTTQLWT